MSKRREHLHALQHNIGSRILPLLRWQTAIYLYPIAPLLWPALAQWMAKNHIEWRSVGDSPYTQFEYRFVGFDK